MTNAMKLFILWLTPGLPPPGPFGSEPRGFILRIDIYESKPYPVVRHEFRGRTVAEVRRYALAHAKSDKFFLDCLVFGRFGNVKCRAVRKWIVKH